MHSTKSPVSRYKDYVLILESACVPEKPLPPRSKQTPEWELIEEIHRIFNAPEKFVTRERLAKWLSENVDFDDFVISFMNLAKPFVIMATDIYNFLAIAHSTMGKAKGIEKIVCREQVEFPFDTSSFERLREIAEVTASVTAWKLDTLAPLVDHLDQAASTLACPDHQSSKRCRYRQDCAAHGRSILTDISSLRAALQKSIDDSVFFPSREEKKAEPMFGSSHRIDIDHAIVIRDAVDQMNDKIRDWSKQSYCVSSDCLPMQDQSPYDELWTTQRLRYVSDQIEAARERYETTVQVLCDFFRLPYWRQRNDLFEVWTLIQACSDLSDIRIGCTDTEGHWRIPGNQQGSFDEPILTGMSARGTWKVFTGVRIADYQFKYEQPISGPLRKKASADAMPDWIFCRYDNAGSFNYKLLAGAAEEFRRRSLIPELIIECKAGASYSLIETVLDPMEARYASLLRTSLGRAVLTNYRSFHLSKYFREFPELKVTWLSRFGRLDVIDPFFPGHCGGEYKNAIGRVLGGPLTKLPVDIVFVIDITLSMRDYFQSVRHSLVEVINNLAGERDIRTALVAVACGDDVTVCPLSNDNGRVLTELNRLNCNHSCPGQAAYEAALRKLNHFSWSDNALRLVVFLGDEQFRGGPYSRWREELKALFEINVKFLVIYPGDDNTVSTYLACMTFEDNGIMIDAKPEESLHERLLTKITDLAAPRFG